MLLKFLHKIENPEAIYLEHNIKTLYKNMFIYCKRKFRYRKKKIWTNYRNILFELKCTSIFSYVEHEESTVRYKNCYIFIYNHRRLTQFSLLNLFNIIGSYKQ